jgi:Serine aminopeptidase, S33
VPTQKRLAERGYAALAFDHRTFGESDGLPRQFEKAQGKAEDLVNAATAIEENTRTQGLPVMAVGVCAGAGYMAEAVARDKRIQAFAGVAGVRPDAEQTKAQLIGPAADAIGESSRTRSAGRQSPLPTPDSARRHVQNLERRGMMISAVEVVRVCAGRADRMGLHCARRTLAACVRSRFLH